MTSSTPEWSGSGNITAAEIAVALGQFPPTEEQVAVIEASPAPALVVAGAGSGKTETMAARVVWLVVNGHVHREEVLGLTFTRKAAGELSERISKRLDRIDEYVRRGLLPLLKQLVADGKLQKIPEAAKEREAMLDRLAQEYGVAATKSDPDHGSAILLRPHVATYNSFADSIVREHGARIGRDPEAALLTESAAWLLARKVVIESKDEALLDLDKNVNSLTNEVIKFSSAALDHRVNLEEVATWSKLWVESIRPHVNPDLARPGVIESVTASVGNVPLLTRLAADYANAKLERGVFDFADQLSGAMDVIELSPDVAEQLRSQYRVVLLDEYQDTSVLQASLLAHIFRDAPVMAVGDPNQAIYAWRGASADNLFAFGMVFASEVRSQRFDLSVSWRNDKQILTAANALLSARADRDTLSVPPLGARKNAGPGRVGFVYEEAIEEEAAAVAEWFEQVRGSHVASGKGISSHSGAILFRAKKHMNLFADALAARGIPHRILGLGGLLQAPEVVDVVSALRVINNPSEGSALIRILSGARFAIGVADLAALHDLAKTLARRDGSLAPLDANLLARIRSSAGSDETASIIDALEFVRTSKPDYRLLQGFTEEGLSRLREAGDMFARLRSASRMPLVELLHQIEIELRLDIELAANETRGPAARSSTKLHAFAEHVRSFLAASERESISALLSWLDYAETKDDLRPSPEPPEPGVVQLLTIHGAKGLEWDAVAIVRLVKDELPGIPRSLGGWLGSGELPYHFRKDRNALPHLEIDHAALETRKGVEKAINEYREQIRSHLEAEDRRLAYVAVTRARTDLLLSGSWWATQKTMRGPSPYLTTIAESLELGDVPGPRSGESAPERRERTLVWPQDPLGNRRAAVEAAAELVQQADVAEPSEEIALLLAEREARRAPLVLSAPTRISASRFKDYVTDFDGTLAQIARPMPERPFPATALGTLFHNWVEQRYGTAGAASLDDTLWESDEDDDLVTTATAAEREALARLQQTFLSSEWGERTPLHVEIEINFPLVDSADGSEHIVICKLDAVFESPDGRIEIVDWKTGRAPKNEAEREDRMLQLALYRLAYHYRFGVPLENIDVALFYVAENLVIRDENVYSESELRQRWSAARAAR